MKRIWCILSIICIVLSASTADKETLAKAFRYLMGKGFDYETARAALSAFGDCEEE